MDKLWDLIRQIKLPFLNPRLGGEDKGKEVLPSPSPIPTPTPTPKPIYRNKQWDSWKQLNPKGYEELSSGTSIASKEYPDVPQDLLMDTSGLETSGGQQLRQTSGGPGEGYFQFEPSTYNKIAWKGFNPDSATDSSRLAAREISKKRLSRWGTPGSKWGVLDNPNRKINLSNLYTKEELNRFLSDLYKLR